MRRRALAGAGASAIGAATAAAALVAGIATGHAESDTSEAFVVGADGLVDIENTPHVSSSDGTENSDNALDLTIEEIGTSVKALNATAGDNAASAEVLDVVVGEDLAGDGELAGASDESAPLLSSDIINADCEGQAGTIALENLEIQGDRLQQFGIPAPEIEPNTEIPLGPLGSIVLNQQTTHDDGSFTINAVVVNLDVPDEEFQQVVLSSATCGGPGDGDNGDNGDHNGQNGNGENGDNGDKVTATKPAPTETELPVTG